MSQTPFRNASVGPVTSPGNTGSDGWNGWKGKLGVDARWEHNLFVVDAEGLLSSGGLLVTADLSRPYVSACLRAGIIYEDFDSLEEPREGVLNFGDGVRVPLTIRTERDYDRLLLPRGWQKSGVL